MSMARKPTNPLVDKNCKPFFPQKTITYFPAGVFYRPGGMLMAAAAWVHWFRV
jgi:hypothetical protein